MNLDATFAARQTTRLASLALLLLTAACAWDVLAPTFGRLDHFDDSAYIRSGFRLVEQGLLTEIAWGPLLSFIYGLAYLVLADSPHWFVHCAMAGRLVIFGVFCAGGIFCVRSLSRALDPGIAWVVGSAWLLAATFFLPWNSSDFLFMGLSWLALARLLADGKGPLKDLALGSSFVGLAALTRNDGLILFVSFLLLAPLRHPKPIRQLLVIDWAKVLCVAALPTVAIVGSYLLLYGHAMGSYEMGSMARTYIAFEQGHGVAFREQYAGNVMVEGYDDVRSLFGSAAENEASVIRAIASNPVAFLERVGRNLLSGPGKAYAALGGALAIGFLLLALRGLAFLWNAGLRWLIVVLAVWHLHLASYVATFWSQRYTRFAFLALTILAAFGVQAIVARREELRERILVATVLGALTAYMYFDASPDASVGALALAVGLCVWVVSIMAERSLLPKTHPHGTTAAGHFVASARPMQGVVGCLVGLALVGATAVALGSPPRWPQLPVVGESAQEQAVAATASLPADTLIAADGHKVPTAAKRASRSLGALLTQDISTEATERWMDAANIGAIYLGPLLRSRYQEWSDFLVGYFDPHPRFVAAFSDAASHTHLFACRALVGRAQLPAPSPRGPRTSLMLRHGGTGHWLRYSIAGSHAMRYRLEAKRDLADMFVAVGDFDGDGGGDVLIRRAKTGGFLYFPIRSEERAAQPATLTRNPDYRHIAVGDFDGDARDDVLLRHRTRGSWIWYALDQPRATLHRVGMTRNPDYRALGIADLDGDGQDDVLLRHIGRGSWIYYSINGPAAELRRIRITRNPAFRMAGIGDFDGDGRDDVLLRNAQTSEWIYYAFVGPQVALHRTDATRDPALRYVAAADFDGDGRDELLLRHAVRGVWATHAVTGPCMFPQRLTGITSNLAWQPLAVHPG